LHYCRPLFFKRAVISARNCSTGFRQMKLIAFKNYYNEYRGHAGLKGKTPIATPQSNGVSFRSYRWRQHCRGLYQTPTAA
jgi:hypothetical protein